MIDESIIGNYRIIKEIGEGGMSYVFLAEHVKLKTKKAVKMLAPHLTGASGFKERFLKEGLAQAQLEHDNIVKVIDYIEQNNKTFIVMDYIQGKCLDEIIELKGRLSEHESIKIARDVLNALNYAHMKNVVHRDIKPSNIIVAQNGKAMLMDFGIAFMVGDKRLTSTGMNIGTSLYMSPEQITSPQKIDHRVDVYSMGVVLYEMLTGEVPFDDDSEYIVKEKHVRELPIPPRQKCQDISKAMEGIVMKALEKDPDNRFHGCGEFLGYIKALESEIEYPDTGGNDELNLSNADESKNSTGSSELADETDLSDISDEKNLDNEYSSNEHEHTGDVKDNHQPEKNKFVQVISIIILITILAFVFISFYQNRHHNSVQIDMDDKYNNEYSVQLDQEDENTAQFDQENEDAVQLVQENEDSVQLDQKEVVQHLEKPINDNVLSRKKILQELDDEKDANENLTPKTEIEITPPPVQTIVINSLDMEFKRVDKGRFMMGTPQYETGRDDDEKQYMVIISKDFFMQTKEVSQEQFKKLMGDHQSWHNSCPNCPVESASWHKILDFIDKLNHKFEERINGRKYRLPTEAEWEYVCRAKTNTPFYFGYSLSENQANFGKNNKYGETTLPVGTYQPNEWGFYDMHGNVSEWCSDWYTDYPSVLSKDPQVIEKVFYDRIVVRGGAWNDKETSCRSGNRMRVKPNVNDANNIGFRLVMTQNE